MYKCSIITSGNSERIIKVFGPENKEMKDRANYELKKTKTGVEFKVTAKDSVALRAMLNSITKLLEVIEKAENI